MRAVRKLFPYLALLLAVGGIVYAVSFGQLPPADFTFVNGTEPESIDPAIVTGVPEGRIINGLFSGLYRYDPKTLEPRPALALRHDLSEDGRTYTFHLRKDAKWSNGEPITAHDVEWSWLRFLHPETAAKYGYQLYSYVPFAEKYATGIVEPGDQVEVELERPVHPAERRGGAKQLFPRGEMLRGELLEIIKNEETRPDVEGIENKTERAQALAQWKAKWVYVVEVDGKRQRFSKEPGQAEDVQRCEWVLVDFQQVPIRAVDDHTVEITLKYPTPYFPALMCFYPMFPVNRTCIEAHGSPDWTKPENVVVSGPYTLQFRRIRDRLRLVKNPDYFDAENVDLEVVDALAVESETTALNLFMNGQVDWIPTVPSTVIPILKDREEFVSTTMLGTYFYRLNITRPPLDKVKVRQALNMAINKDEICKVLLSAGEQPARAFVPPVFEAYVSPLCNDFNPERARELLAEAGFPGGESFPKIEILYNTHEAHQTIAEKIQQDWKEHLGIDTGLRREEWGVYLTSQHTMQYTIARAAWIGDYPDPNTFLDMFLTDGDNNETGWSNSKYDELIEEAKTIVDPQKRLQVLHDAEKLLMTEMPIIPIYFYVSKNMVASRVEGFHATSQDLHPLHHLEVD